eukprot:TRINITY_DN11593_c0_g2_i1.p1 TRINITY_DN11593_c0_g2~~TRINITY_DN11593_c0_g2_i1.p1  ORF type:complete len:1830 (+),score=761.08 TRINITY_DN11593_c0_g2_i1:514-5490(+)
MYHVMHVVSKEAAEGKADDIIPPAPNCVPAAARDAGARERIAGCVYSIFDTVGELLAPGDGKGVEAMLLGLTIVRGVIVLLGPAVAGCTAKITPTLTFNAHYSERAGAGGVDARLGRLLASTWETYIRELPAEIIEKALDAFVVEAVCMAKVSDECAASLLSDLFKKMPKKAAWGNVKHFIPAAPTYGAIRTAIGGPGKKAAEAEAWDSGMPALLSGLTSLSRECRRVSLQALESLLGSHRAAVAARCTSARSTDELDPLLRRVVYALLRITRDWDADGAMRGSAMACLGLIGAVDPTKVGGDGEAEEDPDRKGSLAPLDPLAFTVEDLDDDAFAVRLINAFLFKTLRLQKTSAHDKAAYAIQELFKLLKQRSRSRHRPQEHASARDEVRHYPWWQLLAPEAKELLAPYLDTRYVTHITHTRDAKQVEYVPGMSFRSWLKAWMLNLIGKTAGPRGSVFQAVRNVVKDDIDMALFILPYLVLNVIVHGGEAAVTAVAMEVRKVLSHAEASPGAASEHVQVTCTLLAKLDRWKGSVHERRQLKRVEEARSRGGPSRIVVSVEDEGRAKHVGDLMEKVPFVMLARACRVTNPARSLYYTECHLRSVRNKSKAQQPSRALTQLGSSQAGTGRRWCDPKDLRLYQDVYSRLREPDGLLGVQSLRTQNEVQEGLEEQALDLEAMGHWSDAVQRYELMIEQDPEAVHPQQQLMHCLQALGQYSTAVAYAANRPALREYSAQAAWRLGEWPIVEQALGSSSEGRESAGAAAAPGKPAAASAHDFERGVARSLLAMHKGEYSSVEGIIRETRETLHPELSAASLEGYGTAYQPVVKLHALCDIERAAALAAQAQREGRRLHGTETAQDFVDGLARHTALTELTPDTRGILLSVRRAISASFGCPKHAARTWLEYGKLCRNAGLFQVAEGALLRAERCPKDIAHRPEGLVLQRAKLQRAQGHVHLALQTVNTPDATLDEYEEDVTAIKAKMRLLAVNWACDINHLAAKDVVSEFNDIASQKPSEAVWLSLAKFQDKLLSNLKAQLGTQLAGGGVMDGEKTEAHLQTLERLVAGIKETAPQIMRAYTVSLTYGTKHLYHALPRLITCYINEVTQLVQIKAEGKGLEQAAMKSYAARENPQATAREISKHIRKLEVACDETVTLLNREMKYSMTELTGAVLYTSLPTLVPLLSHKTLSVVKVLGRLVQKVVKLFPERAVWSLIQFLYSDKRERQTILAREVVKPMEADTTFQTALDLYHQAKIATKAINRLAEEKTKDRKVYFHRYDYYRALGEILPLGLVVPIQEQLTLTLPPHPVTDGEAAALFPQNERIKAVLSEAAVMASMQSPKKITFVTTTGAKRSFLCKARDELRKDSRIMELCHIMNLLLKKHPETRRRQLYCRTFAVTLTADQSGMIEWVEGVKPFRTILDDVYRRAGLGISTDEIRLMKDRKDQNKITAVQMYKDICARFPPLYHKWFAENFPDPTAWFLARNNHTKTCAVWSMIGHIVGLGDRHAENILIDTNTGDNVHVDFAVLFDKGMSLMVPEVVRFRLTPNMVDAFGVCGVEGVYRGCAELTMNILRTNKDTVMSIMDQFVNDPCMDRSDGCELPNIERRLAGFYDEPNELVKQRKKSGTGGVQLGVKGQVQKLIANTTSLENFSKIYIWWMAWY